MTPQDVAIQLSESLQTVIGYPGSYGRFGRRHEVPTDQGSAPEYVYLNEQGKQVKWQPTNLLPIDCFSFVVGYSPNTTEQRSYGGVSMMAEIMLLLIGQSDDWDLPRKIASSIPGLSGFIDDIPSIIGLHFPQYKEQILPFQPQIVAAEIRYKVIVN